MEGKTVGVGHGDGVVEVAGEYEGSGGIQCFGGGFSRFDVP